MEIDVDRGSWLQVAIHYQVTHTILDIILYCTLQGTCTELNVVSLRGDKLLRLLREVDAIANLPTGYFEAKPRRAVGFDEVRADIIPNNLDEDIKKGLADKGVPLYEYDYGLWDINS
jgi:hypothetical protein